MASIAASSAGPDPPRHHCTGVATAYEAGDGNGACLFGLSLDLMIAAMNTTGYETSRACGAYVLVRAANSKTIRVRITNECPLPCAHGQLDLSQEAFAELADLEVGRIPITWQPLSPRTSDTVSIQVQNRAQPLLVRHPGDRPPEPGRAPGGQDRRRLAAVAPHRTQLLLSAGGSGCGNSIRITDINGERLTITGIALRPDAVQSTGVQFARH